MSLHVLEYLITHSIADLMAEHGVRLSPGTRPYKASLNYDQIAARDADPLAQQCRGLVLGTLDGSPIPTEGPVGRLRVLARPMDRFFNLGQGAAHPVADGALLHPEARIWEKVDGTLCIVYFDPIADEWSVATRSVPDADRPVDGFGDHTFRSLFELAVREHLGVTWGEFTSWLRPETTYCFELASPRSGSGVVRYDAHQVHLLALRMRDTGEELCPTECIVDGFSVCPSHPAMSLAALRTMVEARSPASAEGVVLRLPGRAEGGGFRRVKVKSSAYVAAHGLSSEAGASPRNLLRIILAGRWDDVAPITRPHLRERGDDLRRRFIGWLAFVDQRTAELRAIHGASRKDFALAVQAENLPIGPMMAIWTAQVADTRAWVDGRAKGGEWGDSFLDTLAGYLGEDPGPPAA